MPSNTARTYLELPLSANVDVAFQTDLNASMRRISEQLDAAATTAQPAQPASSSTVVSSTFTYQLEYLGS